jgi:hypothetical protein
MAPVTIGEMRDYVSFAVVTDVIDPISKRSVKNYAYTTNEYACIRPIGTQLFYNNFDTENLPTHTIFTRWRSDAATYEFIVQRLYLPDTQAEQELMFEIIRETDWNGIRVFTRFDCKLLSKLAV